MKQDEPIDIQQKLDLVEEQWRPHIIAELNGQEVKVVKLLASFLGITTMT